MDVDKNTHTFIHMIQISGLKSVRKSTTKDCTAQLAVLLIMNYNQENEI